MLKKNIVFGLLMSWLSTFAQKADSLLDKRKPRQTAISVLYAQYFQDGRHSAVTGGQGTEKLQVYAPEVSIAQQRDSSGNFALRAGVDVISSASTDKIDFVVSSASRKDNRAHVQAGYTSAVGKSGWTFGANTAISMESDYLSLGGGLSASRSVQGGNRSYGLNFDAYFDDLRWGRLNSDYRRPVTLVYPVELRGQEWSAIYRRQSYNLMLQFNQVLNRRMTLGIYPGLIYQHGLLATPFHRVYFADNSTVRVENLPNDRFRFPLGFQLNSFILDRYILRSYYQFYWDDFGIIAQTLELDFPIKISPRFSIGPTVRVYGQTAAHWFRPYAAHQLDQQFYTSDYDLSAFRSYQLGAALHFSPFSHFGKKLSVDGASLRYSWYKRSDGLQAHMINLVLDMLWNRWKGASKQ
ncbi:MAG: DUF3570 domain-containing protein [Lewinellaceae bacterium]|nr:DUF3570 domain-containing protein [Saprospiraceae bacterium]MCB9330133.1 DUF3570 domain-containing protein [Lewinellaceae bacterium]